MASKQVSEILIKLGIDGLQGLDKLKSSFRELEKAIGPTDRTIESARRSILQFGEASNRSEQLIKGQINAFKGLRSQATQGGEVYKTLTADIKELESVVYGATSAVEAQRKALTEFGLSANATGLQIQQATSSLARLRSEARVDSEAFDNFGKSIAALADRFKAVSQEAQNFANAQQRITRPIGATSAAAKQQIRDLDLVTESLRKQRDELGALEGAARIRVGATALGQRGVPTAGRLDFEQAVAESLFGGDIKKLLPAKDIKTALDEVAAQIADFQQKIETKLSRKIQISFQETARVGRESARAMAAAFSDPELINVFNQFDKRLGKLPNTTAGLEQELSELTVQLNNVERGSTRYVDVSNRIAEVQKELQRELTGTAEAFRKLDIAQAGIERRSEKLAGIQEYYRTQGPLAPGVGGYRDPATGAMIMAGARTPGRIRVGETAYPAPIGPQPFPEAGKRAQESIESALNDVNRIYEDARIRRVEIQSKYDQIHIDKLLEGLELEGRVREKGFRDELAAFDRQLEARDRRRRRRLTTGQAVQSAGAIISGGIFGGPEGFLGGLGGFAAGLAIPALGPVGGAFAGAAGGAQVGAIRQQIGVFAEQAAEISKLRRGLAGVSVDLNDFAEAVKATQAASDSLLMPLGQTIRFYTQLRASTVELNYSTEDTRQILEGTASAVLKTGGSLEDVNGAMRAVIQILSKGKVSAEEMRGQLGERLPGAVIKFAQVNNMSVQELDKAFESGSVTLEKFFNFARKNYEDGAKYANDMATGTEFAGQRMEKALERLRLAIGSRLKESGAGFQDFVTEVVNSLLWAGGELERFGSKVEEFLGSRQFGVAGSTREIAERIIGGGLSVQDLEAAIKAYENKIAEVQQRFEAQADRNVLQQLFDATFGQGTVTESQLLNTVAFYNDLIKKLRAAREEAEKATRQGKAGAGAGTEDAESLKERQKLGQQYLQALEQREEALYNARRQREEQIAQIRKNAIEQAAQIERRLSDDRRNVERDMERVRREMQYGAEEMDRLRRLAAGEDPRIVEAERIAAQISQEATEDRIQIEEDLLDKELEQQRTIADFQKNTAKQIADANENYAKRVGEIQRDFAKTSAKIIEEGSGRAAKRITLAAQIVSQVLERSSINQQRVQFGLPPIGEPVGFAGSRPVYAQEDVPPQIKRIDYNLEQLLRKLQAPAGAQGSLPARRISSSGIGQQFLSLLGAESGYEDIAGLMPLPIQRMQRQAARPLRTIWERIQGAMEGVYGATERQIKKQFKPDLVRNQQVLQRVQKTQEAILNWNPLEAQWKETENQMREHKRSRTIPTPAAAVTSIVKTLLDPIVERVNKAEVQSARLTPELGSPEYARIFSANLGSSRDLSFMLTDNEKAIIKKTVLDVFSGTQTAPLNLPKQYTSAEQKVKALNDLSKYADDMLNSTREASMSLRSIIRNFPEFYEEIIQDARRTGKPFAEGALRDLGRFRPAPTETKQWLQEQQDQRSREWQNLFDQPIIQPGVESQFEGAMLRGRSFNISRLARNFGNIASASTGSPLGYFPAIAQNIQGAAPTTQIRRQAAEQRFEQIDQQALIKAYQVLSEVKLSSSQTLENFKLQNREIELQIQNLGDGMEPELADQLSSLQANYEVQQQQLEIQRERLIAAGLNAEAVNAAYVAESAALARIYEQNQAAIAQYREKQKVLEQIQNVSNILETNLTNAITSSIQVLVTGSGTVKQVLADMFESVGKAFIQMAAQIIAKQLVMIALGSIMKALGLSGGPSSDRFTGGYFDPSTGLGAAGPNFGLAKGGYFAGGMANLPANSILPFANGGIVNKPTFFKFANGGAMSAGVMGEAGPEAIMPLKRGADGKLGVAAQLNGAMQRYRPTPGSAAAVAEGGATAGGGAAGATMEPIDVRYSVERINNVDYVTADQFQRGMAQAAQQGAIQGERRAMRSLKNSSATRRSIGV